MHKKILTPCLFLLCITVYGQRGPSITELLRKLETVEDSLQPSVFSEIFSLYLSQDKFDSALYYANRSLQVSEKTGNNRGIGNAYHNIGLINTIQGNHEKGIEMLYKALSVYEENNFYKESSKTLSTIAFVFADQLKFDEAIKLFTRAIDISEKNRDTIFLITLYSDISEIYLAFPRINDAKKFVTKGYSLVKDRESNIFSSQSEFMNFVYARSLLNKVSAIVFRLEGNFQEASKIYRKELEVAQMYNYPLSQKFDILGGLADNFYSAEIYDSALLYSNMAFKLTGDTKLLMQEANIYEQRSRILKKLGRFKEAYEDYVLYKKAGDSLNSKNSNRLIAEMQTKYETGKKDSQILSLNREKKSQHIIIGLATGAAIIALGFLVFAYRSKKLQQKLFTQKELLLRNEKELETNALQRKMSELEQMALRAQMNPHFIFNSLNSVQHFVMNGDAEGVNKYLGAFAHLIRQTLNNSGKRLVSLNEEIKYLETYLSLEKMKSDNGFSYSVNIGEGIDSSATFIPGMILQPFVENSIRHGVAHKEKNDGQISIHISQNGKLVCLIEDNGIGRQKAGEIKKISSEPEYDSKGMTITMNRIDTINKIYNTDISVQVNDLKDSEGWPEGTQVKIEFPVDME